MRGGRLLALGAVVLCGAALLWHFSGGQKPAKDEAKTPPPVSQTMEGLRLEGGGEGSRWVLTAEKGQSDATGETGALVAVTFNHTANGVVTTGRAARAMRGDAKGAYRFTGGVVVNRGEWTATTDAADYDPIKGVISGEGEITLASGDMTISGKGFAVELSTSNARIMSKSHAVVDRTKGAAR